jgi:hypothetical protein
LKFRLGEAKNVSIFGLARNSKKKKKGPVAGPFNAATANKSMAAADPSGAAQTLYTCSKSVNFTYIVTRAVDAI